MSSTRSSSLVSLLAVLVVLAPSGCTAASDDEQLEEPSAEALTGAYPVGTPLSTSADVNLRAQPSTSAAVLATIPSGATVYSASARPRDGWYGITTQGKTGWVDGRYLSKASAAPTTFTRQRVYQLVQGHMRPGQEWVARDLLDPGKTTQGLVDAIGWLATHNPPSWEISAINSNHHYDPAAHSGGFAADVYARNGADDLRFVQLLVKDPHVRELGFSGDYVRYQGEVRGKSYFTEQAPTHVHLAVRVAYGSPR